MAWTKENHGKEPWGAVKVSSPKPPFSLRLFAELLPPRLSRSSAARETALFGGSARKRNSAAFLSLFLGDLYRQVARFLLRSPGSLKGSGEGLVSADRRCFRPNLAANVWSASPLRAVRSAQASVRLSIGASISVTHTETHAAASRAFLATQYPSHPLARTQTFYSIPHASARMVRARSRATESFPLPLIDTVRFRRARRPARLAFLFPGRTSRGFFFGLHFDFQGISLLWPQCQISSTHRQKERSITLLF